MNKMKIPKGNASLTNFVKSMKERLDRFEKIHRHEGVFYRSWPEWLDAFDETMIKISEEDESSND